jgi:hypothetical protein
MRIRIRDLGIFLTLDPGSEKKKIGSEFRDKAATLLLCRSVLLLSILTETFFLNALFLQAMQRSPATVCWPV